MRPVPLILTVALAVFSLSVVAWLGSSRATTATTATTTGAPAPSKPPAPIPLVVPKEGPFGKAVVFEHAFDFGTVERGSTGSHVFVIKNEGAGPLRVKGGGTSCPQCTVGQVSREDDIAPGETVEVEIRWEIKQASGRFRQTADVYTTDPTNRKLTFGIEGQIEQPLIMIPEGEWPVGILSETEPTAVHGHLFSNIVDDLTIRKVECSNPLVTVTWEPAEKSVLAEKKAKAGIKINVSIAPGTTIGPFRELVKLETNFRENSVIEFFVTGRRPGPIQLIGRNWFPDSNVVRMGEFACTEGAKTTLQMYVRNLDGELEATQVESADERARVTVTPTGKTFGDSKVYDVKIEVPPGPPENRPAKQSPPIVLKMNHPTFNEFKMFLDYLAK